MSPFPLTFYFTQHRAAKFVKKFYKEKDIEAVLQKLDQLMQDEARTVAAQTFAVLHGLIRNVKVLIEGEK